MMEQLRSIGTDIGCVLTWMVLVITPLSIWVVRRLGEIIRLLGKVAGEPEPKDWGERW